MNTEITIIASIFLLLGGLAAFPFTLDYSNTSWMPRWMRPDIDYLERPFRYDYPGRGMQIIFSLLVLFVGAMSLVAVVNKSLSQTVTPGQWFDSMSLVLPACQVSCILFMRQEYNDPFEYADRLTGFSMWKVTAALCLIPLLWLPYVAGLLDSSIYRFTVLSYNLLAYAFLVYDYIRVYRKRFDYEYTGHVGLKEMYPESLYLLAYPVCSVTLLWSLWQNKEVCILVYGVALIIFSLTKTVCRFHPAIRGDEHERCEYLWYRPRKMTTDRARNNSFLIACYSTGNVASTITAGSANTGGVVGINGQGTVTACYHATGEITSSGGDRIGGIAGCNDQGTFTACYWENNQEQGTGSNSGTDDTHKVDVTDVTWLDAVAQMNTALQSAGSGWHYVLNGALPTLEEK